MKRRFHWSMLVVVGGLAAGAGLLGGAASSIRERSALKSGNAELTTQSQQARELVAEVENENQELRARLEQLTEELQARQDEIDRLATAAAPAGDFHPPMISDSDAVIQARITELECEVAALKEQRTFAVEVEVPGPAAVAADAVPAGADPPPSPAKLATKERCTALTKKGTQCTRVARSAGKCWQHGG